jgi:hypothetical protein
VVAEHEEVHSDDHRCHRYNEEQVRDRFRHVKPRYRSDLARLPQCSGMSPDELARLVEARVSVRLPPS